MTLLAEGLQHLFLNPGNIHVANQPTVITTILGSCVALTIFHPARQVGAICHGLLPNCKCGNNEKGSSQCGECFRYVDCSIFYMLERFRELGINPAELELKLFGGADMLPTMVETKSKTVGSQNLETAWKVINHEGLHIKSYDTGGPLGRKIMFFTHTGQVLLKRLHKVRFTNF